MVHKNDQSGMLNVILAGALLLMGVFVAITVVSIKSHADTDLGTDVTVGNVAPVIATSSPAITVTDENGASITTGDGLSLWGDSLMGDMHGNQTAVHIGFSATDGNGVSDIHSHGQVNIALFSDAANSTGGTASTTCTGTGTAYAVWSSNTSHVYTSGTTVAYGGHTYTALIDVNQGSGSVTTPGTESPEVKWHDNGVQSFVPANWDVGGTYAENDHVLYNGYNWVRTSHGVSSETPGSNMDGMTAAWNGISSEVDDGNVGPDDRDCAEMQWSGMGGGGGGGAVTATCTPTDTDASTVAYDCVLPLYSFSKSGTWHTSIKLYDGSGASDTVTGPTFTVQSKSQVAFVGDSGSISSVSYGSGTPGNFTSGGSFHILNQNNADLTVSAHASDMTCTTGSIPADAQRIATSTGSAPTPETWGTSGQALSTGAASTGAVAAARRSIFDSDSTHYAAPVQVSVQIPAGVAGTCSGTLSIGVSN